MSPPSPPTAQPEVVPASLEGGETAVLKVELDIEHVVVADDPRLWGSARKWATLLLIASAGLIASMGASIMQPSIPDIKRDLGATDHDITLTLSLFIIVQGSTPLLWSAISEIKGRKYVYLISILLFTAGSAAAATARTVAVLISMRVLQAMGGSAVLAIGAGTLADVWDPKERGRKLGLYYSVPLLGPAIGPVLGGLLTDWFNWRATFYFLVIFGALMWFAFLLLFKDTFRRERSATYQMAVKRARAAAAKRRLEHHEMKVAMSKGGSKDGSDPTPSGTVTPDISADDIKLTLTDVNPLPPLYLVFKRKNNLAILLASGLMFGFSYTIWYTVVRTLSAAPYNYGSMQCGLALLAFGIGNVVGSIAGGRYSDYILAKRKAQGRESSETRLEACNLAMFILSPSVLMYAWFAGKHLHIASICAALFLSGVASIWMYANSLAYIVDANVGRSSIAVAMNSCFRGVLGFAAAEIAVPVQDNIGDGGLYTIWAGIFVGVQLLVILVARRGTVWRERAEEAERAE